MVRFRFIGKGKTRDELEEPQRKILKKDLEALKRVRSVFVPENEWNSLNASEKVQKYKEIREYLLEFPEHLANGEDAARFIDRRLKMTGLMPEHALEGAEYIITSQTGRKGDFRGRFREVKTDKGLKDIPSSNLTCPFCRHKPHGYPNPCPAKTCDCGKKEPPEASCIRCRHPAHLPNPCTVDFCKCGHDEKGDDKAYCVRCRHDAHLPNPCSIEFCQCGHPPAPAPGAPDTGTYCTYCRHPDHLPRKCKVRFCNCRACPHCNHLAHLPRSCTFLNCRCREEKKIKMPSIGSERNDYMRNVLEMILLLIVGVIISALLGIWQFVLAFLFFAVHVAIPPSQMSLGVAEDLKKVKERYERLIRDAEAKGRSEEEIDRLYKRMETELSTERIIGEFKFGKMFNPNHSYGREFVRELFKGFGFLFLAIAFIFAPIPIAPIVGIIIGFFGYFMLGGHDYHEGGKHE